MNRTQLKQEEQVVKINQELHTVITKYCSDQKISVDAFHARAGVHQNFYYKLAVSNTDKPRNLQISSMIKVADVFGMELDDLIQILLHPKTK